MLKSGFSARSIVNRAYYSMFYMVLALLLKKKIQISTSKHTGIMSTFDKEFILTGLIDRKHSNNLHKTFDRRLEFDYKEMIAPSTEEVLASVDSAREFIHQYPSIALTLPFNKYLHDRLILPTLIKCLLWECFEYVH